MKVAPLIGAVALALVVAGCSSGDNTRSAPTTPSISTYTYVDPLADLSTQYADTFADGAYCDTKPSTDMCVATRDNAMQSLKRSLGDLPQSKEKSDLLVTIDKWDSLHNEWTANGCTRDEGAASACFSFNMDTYWRIARMQLNVPAARAELTSAVATP